MKALVTYLAAALLLASLCIQIVDAKNLTPKKATSLDLKTQGVIFGSIAVIDGDPGSTRPLVTYHIRKKGETSKPIKLQSKKGAFALSLEPGVYEIYDWTVDFTTSMGFFSGKGSSKEVFEFEARAEHLTYIGRIVTDVYFVEASDKNVVPRNHPYLLNRLREDAPSLVKDYPSFSKLKFIPSAIDKFKWFE